MRYAAAVVLIVVAALVILVETWGDLQLIWAGAGMDGHVQFHFAMATAFVGALGLGLIVLAIGPVHSGEQWGWYTAASLTAVLTLTITATLIVENRTLADTYTAPHHHSSLVAVPILLILGLALSRPGRSRSANVRHESTSGNSAAASRKSAPRRRSPRHATAGGRRAR